MPSWAESAVSSTPTYLQQVSAQQQTSRSMPCALCRQLLWWAPPPGLPRDFHCRAGPMAMAGSCVGWMQGLNSSVPLVWPLPPRHTVPRDHKTYRGTTSVLLDPALVRPPGKLRWCKGVVPVCVWPRSDYGPQQPDLSPCPAARYGPGPDRDAWWPWIPRNMVEHAETNAFGVLAGLFCDSSAKICAGPVDIVFGWNMPCMLFHGRTGWMESPGHRKEGGGVSSSWGPAGRKTAVDIAFQYTSVRSTTTSAWNAPACVQLLTTVLVDRGFLASRCSLVAHYRTLPHTVLTFF